MGSVFSYIATIAFTYILSQAGQSLIWVNKKPDGTPKSPWAPSPKNLPWILNGYSIFNQESYHALTKWSKEIGDFFSVKIGSKRITVLNNVKLIHECLIEKEQFNSSKIPSDTQEKMVTDHCKTVYTATFSTFWARLRRAIYIVVGPLYFGQFTNHFKSQAEKLCFGISESLREDNTLNAKQLRQLVEMIAMDTALTMVMGDKVTRDPESMMMIIQKGRELELKQTNKYNRIGQFFPSMNSFLDVIHLFTLDSTMMNARNSLLEIFLSMFDPIYENREKYKSSEEKLQAIAKSLLDIEPSKNDPEPIQLTKDEILINLVHITLHAYTYLSSTIFTLIQRLATEPQLQLELLQEFETQGDQSLAQAFVRESLRMDTPHRLLAYSPRADYELIVDDKPYRIDEASEIVVNIDAIHTNDEYYPNSKLFDPKRYLKSEKKMTSILEFGESNRKVVKDNLAFGAGRRMCLGSKASEALLVTLLYQLVKNYQLKGGDVKEKMEITTNIWSWTGRTETIGTTIEFIKR